MRLTYEQLDRLKDKYHVDRIWSFSRINTWENCETEFWAKYTKHMRLDGSNVYTEWGSKGHDLVEGVVDGKIKPSEALPKWKGYVKEWQNDPLAYQFDTKTIETGYLSNLSEYFEYIHTPEGTQFETEKPVLVRIGVHNKYVFVGYIDTQYVDEDGNTVLVDYKTSSKSSFSKAKLPEKSLQLMLYAIGKHQYNHIPYSKIKCRFDMMKYVRVHFKQENGKWKDTIQERAKWVAKIEKKLSTKLKKLGYDKDKADHMIQVAALANDLDNMPQEIQDQFQLSNYYIELDVNEEACKKVAQKIEHECDEIIQFEKLPEEQQEAYLEVHDPYNPDDYYDKKLCSYHTSLIFKEKEKTLDDLLEPQISDDNDNLLNGLFDEDDTLAGLFSE